MSSVGVDKSAFSGNLVKFTEENRNGKLQLCAGPTQIAENDLRVSANLQKINMPIYFVCGKDFECFNC